MSDQGRTLLNKSPGIHVRRTSIITSDDDHTNPRSALLSPSPRSSPTAEEHGSFKDNNDEPFVEEEDKLKPSINVKVPLITENTIQILLAILGWYSFSLSISLYNKWMFDKSKLNFPFPILITSFHQLLLSILSFISLQIKPSLRPTVTPRSQTQRDWKFYFKHIFPCALASAGDIGAGNASFRFITLTTYTMVKSSSIAFVLLFGVLAKLEKFSYHLLGIVLLMSFGVMLMVDKDDSGDTEKNQYYALGFMLVLASSCMSGLRWVFTQLLLHKNAYIDSEFQLADDLDTETSETEPEPTKKKSPIYTIYQLSPPMFLILFTIGLFIEGFGPFLRAEIWKEKGIFEALILLLIPGLLVFFMTFFEFGILQRAQVITLSIAGIFKELLTIVVSSFIFGDRLTFMNLIGLLLTLADIGWYNYYRYQVRLQEESEQAAKKAAENDVELESV